LPRHHMLWAHSINDSGAPHLLKHHLSSVAKTARSFLGEDHPLATLAYYAGLWHEHLGLGYEVDLAAAAFG